MEYSLVAELRANVTNVDVLKWLMSLEISNLNHEWMRAVVLPVDIKLCHDNCMVGSSAKGTNPPLCRSQGRGVNSEGFVLWIPGSSGLEASDI